MSVPKLRFNKFSDSWQIKNLLELSEGGFTNGVFNDPTKVGRGYKLVNVLDMYIESTIDENRLNLVEIPELEFRKNKVENGDIFFTRSSLVKEGIAFSNTYLGNSQDITFDGHLIRMRPKKDFVDSSFLNYLLKTSNARTQLVKRGKTATMTTIGQADIASIEIFLPQKTEQTKIANFLTAVDEKITQLTQKCDLLAQYKKGVMQQIFSQELRFKDDDGRDFPEWKEKSLGNMAELTSSKRVYLSDYVNEGVPFYRGKEISELKRNETPKDILYITRNAYDNFKSYGVPKVNDILITAVGTLGNVYRIKNESEFYFKDGNLIWLRNVNIYSQFLEILIENNNEKLQKSSIGSTQRALTIIELKKLKFNIPSIAEQTKIANFLTAIDEKINNTQAQLAAVKQYKQGLLQQMFV
jgi:type I restriction enzyme, S subunit